MRRGENFPLLDGLRGVAAGAVLLYHARQILDDRLPSTSAYLAVDFFFMLSGFVVCAAYGQRLKTGLTWSRFMTIRLIRLWPMLAIGAVLGGAVWTVNRVLERAPHPLEQGLLITASAALLLPSGLLLGTQAYPADNPIWSLFFEIGANALYAWRTRGRDLLVRTAVVLSLVILGLLAWHDGTIANFGFNDLGAFVAGVPRVIVPFALGVLVYQQTLHRRLSRVPAWLPVLLLVVALYFEPLAQAWIYDLTVVAVIFPLIVALAAGCRLGEVGTRLTWWCGELSYPAYLIHQPILRAFRACERMAHVRLSFTGELAVTITATLALSWLVLRFVDKPVRRALDRRFLKDRNQREVLLQPAL